MVNWEEYIPKGSDQWESQMVVFRMFDERPIWSEGSLTERLLDKGFSFSISMLRRFLSRISYYFSSGPFQRFWIKKGYDPRKDPDSRIYQRIIFEYQSHYKVTVMLTMPIKINKPPSRRQHALILSIATMVKRIKKVVAARV
ncbi:hypothetical protein RIF29_19173 [Crotalaria pallida]|uniref:Transcription factor IIIC subunit 5 HTH domain-containing protein n=1 Tax=Crotalaria pallida TaxID=3830 RepID=A0AAN9I5A1_CROPI